MPKKKKGKTKDKEKKNEPKTEDTGEMGSYKLTNLIKSSKNICDVLLFMISYNYVDELKVQFPMINKIQTVILIIIELLLSEQTETFVSSKDDPLMIAVKENLNSLITNIRSVLFIIPGIKETLERYKNRDSLTQLLIKLYEILYFPISIIDVFEESDNPDKEARDISFKFLLTIGTFIIIIINNILNFGANIFFIRNILKSFFPQLINNSDDSSSNKIKLNILDVLNIDFSNLKDPYTSKIRSLSEQFSSIKKDIENNKNLPQSLLDSFKFITTSSGGNTVFDKEFFKKKYKERFPYGICSSVEPTVNAKENNNSSSKIPDNTSKTSNTSNTNTSQVGGTIKDISLHKKIEKIKYSNINNFIDIKSLKGIFLLHNYNKYIQ